MLSHSGVVGRPVRWTPVYRCGGSTRSASIAEASCFPFNGTSEGCAAPEYLDYSQVAQAISLSVIGERLLSRFCLQNHGNWCQNATIQTGNLFPLDDADTKTAKQSLKTQWDNPLSNPCMTVYNYSAFTLRKSNYERPVQIPDLPISRS